MNDIILICKPFKIRHLLCDNLLTLCRSTYVIEKIQSFQLKSQELMLPLCMSTGANMSCMSCACNKKLQDPPPLKNVPIVVVH